MLPPCLRLGPGMLDPFEVNFVDSYEEAGRFLRWIADLPDRQPLAIDTETSGLAWDAEVRLVQFGTTTEGWAVPVREWRAIAAEALRLAAAPSERPLLLHNSPFDVHRLRNSGLTPVSLPYAQIHDTLLMSRLADPDKPAGLKPVCSRLFGRESVAGQDLLKQQMHDNRWSWATVPTDLPSYWSYGVLDTILTARLAPELRPRIPSPVYERESAVLGIMFAAEERGMTVDQQYATDLRHRWRSELHTLRSDLSALGITSPGSDQKVTAALKAAGWEPEEFTDTGLPRLDKDVLRALTAAGGYPAEVATLLLRYRRLTKWTSTYLDRFIADGPVLHPEINTLGARTGRMSIRNPALQTLPSGDPTIRNAVIPRQGKGAGKRVLCAIDYSQIEMRMMAHYSGDPALCAAVEAEDLHSATAALAYNTQTPSPAQRKVAKAVNFARIYGAGPEKMADTAGVPLEDITGYIAAFDYRFPGVSQFMSQVEHTAKVRLASEGTPYVTTHGGRTLPGDDDKLYALTNYLLQGSAADVLKRAIVALDSEGFGPYMVVPVHDEIIFDFPADEADALGTKAKEIMEDHTSFSVPITCSLTNNLQRWGDAYND